MASVNGYGTECFTHLLLSVAYSDCPATSRDFVVAKLVDDDDMLLSVAAVAGELQRP